MMAKFEQISKISGFMKHNGGLLFRQVSKKNFEFKVKILNKHSKNSHDNMNNF